MTRARGRLLLDARRRQRRRGGQVLRLDARGGDRGRSATRRADRSARSYDVTERGNWEGHNILNVPRDPDRRRRGLGISRRAAGRHRERAARCKLLGRRAERVRPGRDEKILAGWNGWMLAAFAEAALATPRKVRRRRRAERRFPDRARWMAAGFSRSYKDGREDQRLLEDYAGVAWGLVFAFEASQERRYLDGGAALTLQILDRFRDPSEARSSTPRPITSRSSRGRRTFSTTRRRQATRWRSRCCSNWPSTSRTKRSSAPRVRLRKSSSRSRAAIRPDSDSSFPPRTGVSDAEGDRDHRRRRRPPAQRAARRGWGDLHTSPYRRDVPGASPSR